MKHRMILALALLVALVPTTIFARGKTETAGSGLSVGVVLPTKDEERWTQDQTRFQDAFTKAGYNVQILFSEKDSAKEKANVEALISSGVKAIILCRLTARRPPRRQTRRAGRVSRSSHMTGSFAIPHLSTTT